MQHQLVTTSPRKGSPAPRPSRAQIEPAALALLSRHSAGLLATARRYSITPEDAEDAYQRGVEILLTKAPTTSEDELLPWLRTVVKHEAFAVRKTTTRAFPWDQSLEPHSDGVWTDERAERYEQLRLGAEAMASLKPQEIRCLLLKAEGLSYQEICRVTGFSYTKVNRCLTEGRRSFLQRVARIEAGEECRRLAPLLSKVADGEASAEEMRAVRPHLKSCLACKATLREYRATPSRLAGLVPPVVAVAGGADGFVARIVASLHERFGGMSDVAGAKLAVVASAVVLAGGGAAGAGALHHDPPDVPQAAFAADAPATQPAAAAPGPTPASRPETAVMTPASSSAAPDPREAPPADAATREPVPAETAPEFDPGTAAAPAAAAAPAPAPEAEPPSAATGGSGEFGP